MDKKQAIEIARRYKEEVSDCLPVKAVYLYGSYSKGGYRDESDIDIAVIVSNSGDYFKDTPLLWRIGRKVNFLIEPVLLSEDVNDPLYYDILKTGILI
ncbi:MAG: nucleotidyltransferase domain-containing protein [Bacteroides sp.]|nr:nucleotidyltransferase domain-containing protein [Bacteroides sp.]